MVSNFFQNLSPHVTQVLTISQSFKNLIKMKNNLKILSVLVQKSPSMNILPHFLAVGMNIIPPPPPVACKLEEYILLPFQYFFYSFLRLN